MKNFVKLLILSCMLATPAFAAETAQPEQDKYQLSCKASEVCFEQDLKNARHNFQIEPGSSVRVEALAKSGATVLLTTGGATMSSSYMQVGTNSAVRQQVGLQAVIDKTGSFAINVETAQVTINGVPQNNGDAYHLKITRINAAGGAI